MFIKDKPPLNYWQLHSC